MLPVFMRTRAHWRLRRVKRQLSLVASLVSAMAVITAFAGTAVATAGSAAAARGVAAGQALAGGPIRPASGGAARAVASDEVLSGVGDTTGYHLFLARASEGWQWQPLVVLAPGGSADERWIGRQCLTGDGRTAVAVVAPWHMVNRPEGNDRGGTAIAVDVATHRTRVLATGVSLYYFNPGCGAISDVALTRFPGRDEQSTQVLRIGALTGKVEQSVTLPGEATSAIPVNASLLAAEGGKLVHLTGQSVATVAKVPGEAFDLRPNVAGGADLLAAGARATASAWRWAPGRLTRLGQGPLSAAHLWSSRGAGTVLFGVHAGSVAGLAVHPTATTDDVGASLQGTAVLTEPAKMVHNAAQLLPEIRDATGKLIRAATAMPKAAPERFTAAVPAGRAATARAPATRERAVQPVTSSTTPKCAVPRDSLNVQVPQPSNAQVNWAIQRAVTNSLPARPAGFDNLPGGSYSPETDFPQPSLAGGSAGSHVPKLVVDGILAQESNWDEASWHAGPDLVGNPLIADYYGSGGDLATIDYANADCGYGIGQITDIMSAGAYDPTTQQRVAVDYAENIAAAVRHLATTWNQLAAYSPPVTVNGANPAWLENWYTTIWAYNSGVQPASASLGLPSGCTQAGPPNCTDSAGNWGLGWSNNPVNPVYPPGRGVFLQDSYADASHPGDWPYQERVFGWIATPLQRYDPASGGGVAAYTPSASALHQPPLTTFCSTTVNNCDPNDPSKNYCLYQAAGPLQYHCWWHQPVTFAGGCSSGCLPDRPDISVGSEPSDGNPDPPVCNLNTSQVPTSTAAGSTVIVSEEATPENTGNLDINLAGCPQGSGRNWTNKGAFTLQYATDANGNPVGQIDLHQLGIGFGGHMWFTHTNPPSGAQYYQVTGTWRPNITLGVYQVKVFVPDLGADAAPAVYTISSGNGNTVTRAINQADYGNQWVSLGDFALASGASVSLSNITPNGDYTSDLAFSAVAFIPRQGTLIHHTVDAFSNFGDAQSLDTTPPTSWISGDFAGDASLTDKATSLINGILGYPLCPGGLNPSFCTGPALRGAMSGWQQQVTTANGHPVQWLGFSRPAPPNPLPSSYLDDGTRFKIRASVNVDYLVVGGAIDPASVSVTATNETGITHIPGFITDTFNAIASDYQILPPDLSYAATNLQFFNGQDTSWDPLLDNLAPGREYMPKLSVQLTGNNTCLQVQDIAGGAIGWKTILLNANIPNRVQAWDNSVHQLVTNGKAPPEVADLADMITTDFFTVPSASWLNPPPWVQTGSIFYFAPPIWVESHFSYCADGSLHTAGNVDPITNKSQLVDNSYMPDLYLAIDGTYVDKYGKPTGGGPVQYGDWPDFSVWPGSASPNPSPWNICYIGPSNPGGSQIPFISRRDGNPWNLPLLNPGDLSSNVTFC
jgi:hypothetical protein